MWSNRYFIAIVFIFDGMTTYYVVRIIGSVFTWANKKLVKILIKWRVFREQRYRYYTSREAASE